MYTVNDIVSLVNKYISSHSRYQFLYGTFEDMRSEMLLEVYKKINKYDEDRGNLSTFIYTVLESKIKKDLFYTNSAKRSGVTLVSLDTPINSDSEKLTLSDIIPDEYNFEEDVQNRDIVSRLLPLIRKETYEHYILGIPVYKIAQIQGVTKQEISRRICSNLKRLNNIYNRTNISEYDLNKRGDTMYIIRKIMADNGCSQRTAFRKLAKMRKENENNNK